MTAQIEKREIGNLLLEGIPVIPKGLSDKLNQYQNTREANLVGWINDGNAVLITTRFGESLQFHIVSKPSGQRKQITFFNEPIFNGKVRPCGNGFLFSKDIGGNETYQLFYFDLTTYAWEQLTDGKSKNAAALWNKKGNAFVYTSTKRNQKDHDLYLYDFETKQENLLLKVKGLWYPMEWSPDGRYLTVLNYHSINESPLYCLDTLTGNLDRISSESEITACRGGIWTKDGNGLYYTSDQNSQFRQLIFKDFVNGKEQSLTTGLCWDVEHLQLSPDGRQLAFTTNQNGFSKLYLLQISTNNWQEVTALPECLLNSLKWHPDSQQLAITMNTAKSSSDVYIYNLITEDLKQWTSSELGGLKADSFIQPKLMHYPTFDQIEGQTREIPAFYYQPKN